MFLILVPVAIGQDWTRSRQAVEGKRHRSSDWDRKRERDDDGVCGGCTSHQFGRWQWGPTGAPLDGDGDASKILGGRCVRGPVPGKVCEGEGDRTRANEGRKHHVTPRTIPAGGMSKMELWASVIWVCPDAEGRKHMWRSRVAGLGCWHIRLPVSFTRPRDVERREDLHHKVEPLLELALPQASQFEPILHGGLQ